MKLLDLDPQLLTRVSPVAYEVTDDVACAHALALRCPACHWAGQRTNSGAAHAIIVWPHRPRWGIVGRDYGDLSLRSGRTPVTVSAGWCHTQFQIRNGRVDFH